jgi:hypothetical protein
MDEHAGIGRRVERNLGLDVEYASSASLVNLIHGVEGCAVKIARKFGMLYESRGMDEVFERLFLDEEVLFSVCFAGSRVASGI